MLARPDGPQGFASALTAYRLVHSPYQTLTALHQQFGSVFRVGRGTLGAVYLVGPAANRLLMGDGAHMFRWREAFSMLSPIAGDTALILSDGERHRHRRQQIRAAFATARVEGYGPLIAADVRASIDRWQPGKIIDIHASLRATVRRVVIRVLFGDDLAATSAAIGRPLEILLAQVNNYPLRNHAFAAVFTRTQRARAALDDLIYAGIRRRRLSLERGHDLLADLLEARDEHGALLDDVRIRDQIVSLITAGFDTTSAALGWTLLALLRQPELWQQVADEVREHGAPAVAGPGPSRWLDAVVKESLRLFPPVAQGGRRALVPFEFDGCRIQAGSLVVHSPYLTHRLTDHWSDPTRFEPRRWLSAAPACRDPYAYVPFGAGARRCVGARLATAIIHAVIAEVVTRTRLHLLAQHIEPTGLLVMAPKHGIMVRVDERHDSSASLERMSGASSSAKLPRAPSRVSM